MVHLTYNSTTPVAIHEECMTLSSLSKILLWLHLAARVNDFMTDVQVIFVFPQTTSTHIPSPMPTYNSAERSTAL